MIDSAQKRLVRRLKARDPKAFDALILQHQTLVFNLLYRMLGSKEEAEDLLQEVFITVFKQIDSFRGDANLSTWIYKIATNHCINRKKYLTRRKHYDKRSLGELTDKDQPSGGGAIASTVPRPDELAEGHQMERIIQDAISSLDDEYKIVLVLRDVQNLSYEEIEQIIGVPSGTVKSRLHRARMALKEKIGPNLR